ncbi:hypothetical protein [Cellulomonas timonensis]|uniref:hypothetical protein n=1 Tax=Cellulomonas timonensis TaxID=1689271 RepID=UPI00082D5E26|nr:hypothetical protein [Cellulomonas timonensis]
MKSRGWILVGAAASLSLGLTGMAQAGGLEKPFASGSALKPVTIAGRLVLADALAAPGRPATPWAPIGELHVAPPLDPVTATAAEAAPALAPVAATDADIDPVATPVANPEPAPIPAPAAESTDDRGAERDAPRGDKGPRGHQKEAVHDRGEHAHGASPDRSQDSTRGQMVDPHPAQRAARAGGDKVAGPRGAETGGRGHTSDGREDTGQRGGR